ncbi:hypothetical protein SAMN02910292_03039 [Lachnospiraceae bacterium XBB2008]|nr:hypothetical protein SAMN02910292_03039 [Lachnospiraceae bacterium XBB2008]
MVIEKITEIIKWMLANAQFLAFVVSAMALVYEWRQMRRSQMSEAFRKSFSDLIGETLPSLLQENKLDYDKINEAILELKNKAEYYKYTDKAFYNEFKYRTERRIDRLLEYSKNRLCLLFMPQKKYDDLIKKNVSELIKYINGYSYGKRLVLSVSHNGIDYFIRGFITDCIYHNYDKIIGKYKWDLDQSRTFKLTPEKRANVIDLRIEEKYTLKRVKLLYSNIFWFRRFGISGKWAKRIYIKTTKNIITIYPITEDGKRYVNLVFTYDINNVGENYYRHFLIDLKNLTCIEQNELILRKD